MTEEAFQSLKRALARSVSLAYLWPDHGFYYLDTDANGTIIWAALVVQTGGPVGGAVGPFAMEDPTLCRHQIA